MAYHDSYQPPRAPVLKASQALDYKEFEVLKKCLGPQGQIQGRRRTGFSAQRQRELKTAVKRARHMALLPFVG